MIVPQYVVIEKEWKAGLMKAVNRYIQAGWKPLGGVSVQEHSYSQAMIRPLKQEKQ